MLLWVQVFSSSWLAFVICKLNRQASQFRGCQRDQWYFNCMATGASGLRPSPHHVPRWDVPASPRTRQTVGLEPKTLPSTIFSMRLSAVNIKLRGDEAEPVAGLTHECVVAQCIVTKGQTRGGSVPAAGGSGRGPNQISPQPQPLTFTFNQHRPACIRNTLPWVAHPGQTQASQSHTIHKPVRLWAGQ